MGWKFWATWGSCNFISFTSNCSDPAEFLYYIWTLDQKRQKGKRGFFKPRRIWVWRYLKEQSERLHEPKTERYLGSLFWSLWKLSFWILLRLKELNSTAYRPCAVVNRFRRQEQKDQGLFTRNCCMLISKCIDLTTGCEVITWFSFQQWEKVCKTSSIFPAHQQITAIILWIINYYEYKNCQSHLIGYFKTLIKIKHQGETSNSFWTASLFLEYWALRAKRNRKFTYHSKENLVLHSKLLGRMGYEWNHEKKK